MLREQARQILQLKTPPQVTCPAEYPYEVFRRTLPDAELRLLRNSLAGQELDVQAIRERYLRQVELPSYSRKLFLRRSSFLVMGAAAAGLVVWNSIARVLDWVEYEVYIK
jgi:hypothetical protein